MARGGEDEGKPFDKLRANGAGENADGDGPPKPHRQRHDGFTPKKQRKFFKALKKTGCLKDAARAAGISTNTVRRHRDKWPAFNARTEATLGQAAEALETIAWHRATVGAEEKIYRDGKLVAEAKRELKRKMYAKHGNKEQQIASIMRRLGAIRDQRDGPTEPDGEEG